MTVLLLITHVNLAFNTSRPVGLPNSTVDTPNTSEKFVISIICKKRVIEIVVQFRLKLLKLRTDLRRHSNILC